MRVSLPDDCAAPPMTLRFQKGDLLEELSSVPTVFESTVVVGARGVAYNANNLAFHI